MSRYEQVLRHIRYRNWRPASLESRRFRIKCSELNGRYTSNEFNLEVSAPCGCKGSPGSSILSLMYSGGLLPLAHLPLANSPSPFSPRSASSMRSESQTMSTSTTSSCSLPSSSRSTTLSPRLASSAVQVRHLAGETSGQQITQDHPLKRHLGCSRLGCPDLREGPDNGEAVDPGSEALTEPPKGTGQVNKLQTICNNRGEYKGLG